MIVTPFLSGILGLMYLVMTYEVIMARRKFQISVGFGPKNEIANLVSAHSNFSNYAIFFVILLFNLEFSQKFDLRLLGFFAGLFLIGRILHYRAFREQKMNLKWRIRGMRLTLLPILILSCLNISLPFI